jgi:hypothetical protein
VTIIKFRRGTAAEWTAANTVLAQGEPGIETDTGYVKVGDGSTPWTALPYSTSSPSIVSDRRLEGATPGQSPVKQPDGGWAPDTARVGGSAAPSIRTFSGAADTLVIGDAQNVVLSAGSAPATETIPANSSVNFPVGTYIVLHQNGIGPLSVAAGSGVTLNVPSGLVATAAGRFSRIVLQQVATNVWDIGGDLVVGAAFLNPGFEADTAAWSAAGDGVYVNSGATLTRVTSDHHSGSACGQVVTTASSASEGIQAAAFVPSQGFAYYRPYTVTFWAKSVSGSTGLLTAFGDPTDADSVSTLVTLTTSWAEYVVTWIPNLTGNSAVGGTRVWPTAVFSLRTSSAGAAAFNVDDFALIFG